MENKNKSFILQMAAMITAVIMLVLSVFGIGYSLGLFNTNGSESGAAKVSDNLVIGESKDNGISLTSAKLMSSANSTAESTYTLSATVTPSYATNQTLSWSITWDTSWSGYMLDEDGEDVYGNGWIDGSYLDDDSYISDYVSLSSTTGKSVTVSCWQPFGNPIIITVRTTDGTNLSSSCKVDYQSYYTGVYVSNLSSVSMVSSGSSTSGCCAWGVCTTGTLAASGSLTYTCSVGYTTYTYDSKSYTCYTSNHLANWARGDLGNSTHYTSEDAWAYHVYGTSSSFYTSTTSLYGDSDVTIFKFSRNWSTFVQELIDGNDYITGNDSGWTYAEFGNYALIDFYNAINYCGIENFHPFAFEATLTDDKTGATYTASTEMTFASLSTFPTYSVTSLSVASSIVF